MFRMYASNSHSYTHLILALGIVREPTVWGFITSKYLAYMTLAGLLSTQAFGAMMEASFKSGLWRAAGLIVERRLAETPVSRSSTLSDLTFLAKTRALANKAYSEQEQLEGAATVRIRAPPALTAFLTFISRQSYILK